MASRYGRFPRKLKRDLDELDDDVRGFFENYSLEAMHACRKMTDKLQGYLVTFVYIGKRHLQGRIEQVTDQFGSIWFVVSITSDGPKNGKIVEVAPRDIVRVEKVNG